MPTFSSAQVTDPFLSQNELLAPMLAHIAAQEKLGNLDINRRELALKENKFAQGVSLGDEFARNIDGTTGSAIPGDSTPFERKMGFSEGGGTADKVNSEGYAGQYQFGAARLADLGLYTPAQGEDLKRNEWKGTFKIAPYGVANLQDFLKNPAAQHAAFVAHVADVDRMIDATPGADKFDRNGLRAVAHLGGNGGMQAFVASGGNLNRADSNGTSLKAYYQKFADGGAPLLQKAFGAAHGPGGPQSNLPTVQPGRLAGWVDPNAPLPVPPIPPAVVPPAFNPNTGPRVAGASPAGAPGVAPVVAPGALPPAAAVGTDDPNAKVSYPPVVTGQADETVPVEPSRQAMRLGGVAAAGDAAGPGLPDPAPNRMAYGTGLPGVTIGLPTNGLAPPPVVTAAALPPVAQPPAPTPVQPPPAPSRVIQREPLIQSGMARGLTRDQALNAARLFKSGADPAAVLQHIDQLRHQNDVIRQGDATQAAIDEKENYDRRKAAEQTAYTRGQDAKRDAREEVAAKNAGMPPGYRLSDKGIATRIDGLPPDPQVAQAAKDAYDAEQRKLPFQGTGTNEQNRNILIDGTDKGKVNTTAYKSAYADFSQPRTEGGVTIHPDMTAYRLPEDKDGNPITTYGKAHFTIGPGDITKLRSYEQGAAELKTALDVFATKSRNASFWERNATNLGQSTELSNAWTNAALLAKGDALYQLGVLSGPDMSVIRGALADPSTFMGRVASNDTIDKQVDSIKKLLETRLDQARQIYGGGMSPGGGSTPAAPTATKSAPPAPPAVGAVQDGYRFKGGNPASPDSWESVK